MGPAASETQARAARVRLVLFDSDGVFTDGRIYSGAAGEDLRAFDVRDGHGLVLGRQAGLTFGVMSGRESGALTQRAADLGLSEVHQGVKDKGQRLEEILGRLGVRADETCFMGDDLIDLPAMRRVGFAVAPCDAVPEVLDAAHFVTAQGGGRGALRELIELILRANGTWSDVIQRFYE